MADLDDEEVFELDSDLCESSDEEEQQRKLNNKAVKERVDEYLTTSRLGRLAYCAGDVQLAKDRFNLAMNLEFLTEMENTTDFGVTGGMLRNELLSRNETDIDVVSISDEKLSKNLSKLQKIFVKADEKAALNTADTQSFLLMGAALNMLGEWEKAENVYKEGIAASPGNNQPLVDALNRLSKLRDTIELVGCQPREVKKRTPSTLRRNRKPKRPSSQHVSFDDSGVVRSRSFSSDLNSIGNGKVHSLVKDPPPLSPLVGGIRFSPQPKKKNNYSFQKIFKKDRWRPKSMLLNGNGMSFSSSSEDLRSLGVWRERSTWKSAFDFNAVKQSLKEFNSRTIQTMRVIDHSTANRQQQSDVPLDFKW